MFKSFQDYVEDRKNGVDSKDGLVGSPKTKIVADYEGPDPKSPTKGEGQSTPAPYRAANGNGKPKKGETGFGDMGDANLKYNPDTKGGNSKLTSLGTELISNWKGKMTKTEQFIDKTKNMSLKEFADHMIKECSCKINGNLPMVNADSGPFHPRPSEAIRYVAALGSKNHKIVEQLVHEMKRANIIGEMLEAALEYPESYRELSNLFENEIGEKRARSFARALSESVAPPMGLRPDEEDEEGDTEGDGMEDMGDEENDMGDEDMGDMEDDEEGEEDYDDMDDEEDMEDEPDEDLGMGDEDMSDDEDMGMGDEEMGPPPKFKKHAHSNIMNSISRMGLR